MSTVTPRRKRWPVIVGGLFIGLMFFGVAGFFTVSALEEQDTFCISCHTAPEVTYYNRAYLALDRPTDPLPDLSTAHYHAAATGKKPFACIDCHRGDSSLPHRVSTLTLAARDALIFVAGRDDPTLGKENIREAWLPNASCVGCHTETLLNVTGLPNHYHTLLPQAKAAQAKGKIVVGEALQSLPASVAVWSHPVEQSEVRCTTCHVSHAGVQPLPNAKSNFFMESGKRNMACVSCHLSAGKGPQDPTKLGN
jgi:nitrate/TMAO reductase-like tetraheme cytochrome c subunit